MYLVVIILLFGNKVSADSNDLLGFGIATLRFGYPTLSEKDTSVPKNNMLLSFGINPLFSCTAVSHKSNATIANGIKTLLFSLHIIPNYTPMQCAYSRVLLLYSDTLPKGDNAM